MFPKCTLGVTAPSHRRCSALLLAMAVVPSLVGCHSVSHPQDLQSFSITLERTPCYGKCPAYTLALDGDGNVKYLGKRFVDIPGMQTAKIQPEQMTELLRAFAAIHFFDLQDKYVDLCTDNPTEFISLTLKGRTKRIENYFCGPGEPGPSADLVRLARQIDSAAGTSRWIQCKYECLTEQVRAGLSVNAQAPDGSSPLTKAIERRDLLSVRLLLSSGAQPNTVDSRGFTPLMYAAMGNSPEMVRELLAHGADVNAKDNKGFSAVDMVAGGSEVEHELLAAHAKPHRGK